MARFVSFSIFIPVLVVGLFGCAQEPDEAVIESVIRDALKDEVPPLAIGNMLGGSNAEVTEFEILNTSYEKEEPNAISAAFGAKPQNYWLVEVRVKGTATVGASDMMSAMLSGGKSTTQDFHSRIQYRLYERDNGSWYTK